MYVANFSFKIGGEKRTFHEKEKLKRFMSTKPALQKILKNILNRENKAKNPDEMNAPSKTNS